MPTYGQYWPVAAKRWDTAKATRKSQARAEANKLKANKPRYEALVARFASVHPGAEVPWWWVACAHMRESGARFDRQLAQGDPLDQVSTHEPKGEGPYRGPDAWERSGIVAMEAKNLQNIRDWRLEKALYWWEAFNGFGPWDKGLPSAYIWSGLSTYDPPTGPGGKYVADHDWDPRAVDKQMGCAAILKELMELDSTIQPQRETPMGVEPAPVPSPTPTPPPIVPPPVTPPAPQPRPVEATVDWNQFISMVTGFVNRFSWMVPAQYQPIVKIIMVLLPLLQRVLQNFDQVRRTNPDLFDDIGGAWAQIKTELPKVQAIIAPQSVPAGQRGLTQNDIDTQNMGRG